MSFHVLACISAHGFGHFAMTAPILDKLSEQYNIKLSVRTRLPHNLIHARIKADVNIIEETSDFGMVMHSSLDVDISQSAKAYARFHEDWQEKIKLEADALKAHQADLIIANIPYLTVAAARQAGIPCIAYCSLNWADIFHAYFSGKLNNAQHYLQEMRDAYNMADKFICPEPSMKMQGINHIESVGPVAKTGINRKADILLMRKLSKKTRLVLITPGGVATPVPVNSWQEYEDVHWVLSWEIQSSRSDITSISDLPYSFTDVLASCDAVITKPGYGTVTEAVCNNVPALYVLRGDWAEELFLVDWWKKHGRTREISREQFFSGNFHDALLSLWQQKNKSPVDPSGIQQFIKIASEYIFPLN